MSAVSLNKYHAPDVNMALLAQGQFSAVSPGEICGNLEKIHNKIKYAKIALITTLVLAVILSVTVSPIGLVGVCAIIPYKKFVHYAERELHFEFCRQSKTIKNLKRVYTQVKEHVIHLRDLRESEIIQQFKNLPIPHKVPFQQLQIEKDVAQQHKTTIDQAQLIVGLDNQLAERLVRLKEESLATSWQEMQKACSEYLRPNNTLGPERQEYYVQFEDTRHDRALVAKGTVKNHGVICNMRAS